MKLQVASLIVSLGTIFALLWAAFAPARPAWDGLTDAVIRVSVLSTLSLLGFGISIAGIYIGQHPRFHWIMLALWALPALGALVFFTMMLIKMA